MRIKEGNRERGRERREMKKNSKNEMKIIKNVLKVLEKWLEMKRYGQKGKKVERKEEKCINNKRN